MSIESFSEYLTYSDEDLKWQVICMDVGSTHIPPYSRYPPDRRKHPEVYNSVSAGRELNEYQLIYISRGSGTFRSRRETYRITPGTVMIVFPGIPHAYHPDFEIGWDEYWVGFAGNYLDSLAREKVITPDNPVYHIGLQDIVQAHFAAIFERARQHRPLYQLKTSAQVMLLLAEVLSLYRRRKQKSRSERLVERVKFIMREELLSNVSMKELARRLAVSEPYLREVFKSHTDRSPYQYYLHLKINKAKEYLVYHDSSIKEIAHRLSFEDQYYFSRLFKKKTGISPSQWSLGHDDV